MCFLHYRCEAIFSQDVAKEGRLLSGIRYAPLIYGSRSGRGTIYVIDVTDGIASGYSQRFMSSAFAASSLWSGHEMDSVPDMK